MCLTPIMIDNPYYNSPIRAPDFHLLHDTVHAKLPVPCGRCSVCIHLKQQYLVQRVQMESLSHDLFYGTLTYNQESLPIAEIDDFRFAYADYSDWQKMIKMIRKDYPEFKFRYMLVSEYGAKKHRPHYHFILSFPRTSEHLSDKVSLAYRLFHIFLSYWRRNYGSTRSPIWKPLCTYVNRGVKYNYDLHYLDPNSSVDGLDGVSFYVSKYILKYDKFVEKFKSKLYFNLDPFDFKTAWDLFRPRILLSKGFGSPDDPKVISHITHGINFALSLPDAFYPYYISLVNGSTFPLSPYYSKRFLNEDSAITFRSRLPDQIISESDIVNFDRKQEQLAKVRYFLYNRTSDGDFDDIDDINSKIQIDGNYSTANLEDQVFAVSWKDFDFDRDHDPTDCDDLL